MAKISRPPFVNDLFAQYFSLWMGFIFIFVCVLFPLTVSTVQADTGRKKIAMVIMAGDSVVVARVFKEIKQLPGIAAKYSFSFYTDREIRSNRVKKDQIQENDIVLADFMNKGIVDFLASNLKKNSKVYSLRCAYLADELKNKGIKINTQAEEYYQSATHENVKNLLFLVLSREGGNFSYGKPFLLPKSGIFHPDAPNIFSTFDEYIKWYKKSAKYNPQGFWVGIHTFSNSVLKERGNVEAYMINSLEKEGINTLSVFGRPPYHKSLEEFFLDKQGKPRVQIICDFLFRFMKGDDKETKRILQAINAPVFMPLLAHSITIEKWKSSPVGISPLRIAWQVCIPEQNGAIEPSMVGGKTAFSLKEMTDVVFDVVPMEENIDFLIKRMKGWHRLQALPAKEKKVAILYWNHPPGKQNVGASYLNIFKSISNILGALKQKGYTIKDRLPSDEEIKKLILLGGRNVGSYAPGELDKLIAKGKVIKIPLTQYKKWFKELDTDFQEEVIRQWGSPDEFKLMAKNNNIIIPAINLGNILLLAQPSRGFSADPEKLYHDTKLYPHHQYIAFYLWLKKEFNANAIISLGKHGTHEWLPGKQVGLSLSDPPEVLAQDIPNIYPYIVDNIGEGIQAKRRGRGVIIDHLIPPLEKGGSYMEYRELTALIDEYHNALNMDAALAGEKLKRVQKIIRKIGLDRDLNIERLDHGAIEEVEHYILELQEKLIPYGMHTFGVSPQGTPLSSLAAAICFMSPEIKQEDMEKKLKACGANEMKSLLKALDGGYIPPGEGNDPVRNPAALPTGRNFYGFSVDKVPSREAFTLGKKMADEIIKGYIKKHGTYPDKVGVILWSTELQRNEGANVGAVLSLLGIRPVWDKKDRVVDIAPIAGDILKRPRIDVIVQTSGLFRDSYAKIIHLIDRGVRMAGSLKDVENFIAINNRKIKERLIEKGYQEKEAEDLSQARIFGPKPGTYSTALQKLIPNSGIWEDEKELADVFIHHSSFAYGEKLWGKPMKSLYKNNLKDVKVTVHTRSSNLYNMLDNDDMFAFLGGLSLAVKSQKGEYPDVLVSNMQNGKDVKIEDLPKAIGKALRTRYLNPKWIKGMKKEGYAGARNMDKFVEHLWGFQVTTPYAVDKTEWEQIHEVYVQDKYGLELEEFFNKNNPWALQSMTARMLEANRKEYWKASTDIKKDLARTYALNVIEKGVACCEHTCNNPMLQQFVTNIISLYGLLTPRQLDQFKMVMAKATGNTQEENEAKRKQSQESLTEVIEKIQKEETVKAKTKGKKIEGFEMVEEKNEETKMTASGSSWVVMVIVAGFLALLFMGWKRNRL